MCFLLALHDCIDNINMFNAPSAAPLSSSPVLRGWDDTGAHKRPAALPLSLSVCY